MGELDPDLPLFMVFSLDDAIDYGHANVRISVRIVGWLGASGLLVAVAGLYALLAVRVTERTREIGVRRAVGASGAAVGRAVLGQVVAPLAVGLAVGFLLALPAAQQPGGDRASRDHHATRILRVGGGHAAGGGRGGAGRAARARARD